jgi:GTPase SAR1 family protein
MKVWVAELKENGPKNIGKNIVNVVIAIVGNKIDLMSEKEEVPYS